MNYKALTPDYIPKRREVEGDSVPVLTSEQLEAFEQEGERQVEDAMERLRGAFHVRREAMEFRTD